MLYDFLQTSIVVKLLKPHQSAPIRAGACMKLMAMATFSFAAFPTHMGFRGPDASPTAPVPLELRLWLLVLQVSP
jgi:hypothetical protein